MCDLKVRGGVAHFAGLKSCGSIWVCPVCSAKVAARRIQEVAAIVGAHLEAPERGTDVYAVDSRGQCEGRPYEPGAVFLTLTFSHHAGMKLSALLAQRQEAWAGLRQSRAWRSLEAVYDVEFVGMKEHTWGKANGWHPHLHAVLLTNRWLTEAERQRVWQAINDEWLHQLERVGLSGQAAHAVRVDAWNDREADDVAGYLAKQLAMEVGGGGFKEGRDGQYTPWQILDVAADGDVEGAWAVELWAEHEQATFGKHAKFVSAGARALQPQPEKTDEEIAEEDVGGDLVVSFDRQVKAVLWALSPGGVEILDLCENDRAAAIAYVLAHAPPGGQVFLPIPLPDDG